MYDPELYRPKDEVERWKQHDPITTFVERATAEGLLDDADVDAVEAEVAAELDEAVAFAERGTLEPVDDLTRHVVFEGTIA
jgi:TPP-dependent pyruvate/acetoin dehydrogenase alpha subunit